MSKTIKSMWHSYSERVIPRNAGVVQRMECRRAFYAGAQAYNAVILNFLEPGTDEITDADMALIQELQDELNQFCQDVERGKA